MEKRNSVNLSVNPCKMCMPLGAVVAMKGIENSMVIMHGSQGCSTYIRRHMATHYNEPIDIASSSLTEQGTIYGGASNLKKGLKNIIDQYSPSVIGVLTTCLSETIGEDIGRIITEFKEETFKENQELKIIPIPTPAYSGTQAEGYYKALRRMVEDLSKDEKKSSKINIIIANTSPGDVRHLKYLLDLFEVEYTLLPDISETLDGGYHKKYSKIPAGGTSISKISGMGGACATIEMGLTIDGDVSPGEYLEYAFNVPLYKCAIPMGIKNSDEFINLISKISGKAIPEEINKERARYLDGIIDSHKYNSEGRAVIFGEPELVYGITSLCIENGIQPVLIATGSSNAKLGKLLETLTGELEEKPIILEDCDFGIIEKMIVGMKVNLLIGDSNGRRIEDKLQIKLIRIGFPIHDRVGAQRTVNIGYNGSLRLLDEITNSILEKKERSYRKDMYDKYFNDVEKAVEKPVEKIDKTSTHPCFNQCAHEYARMHIPVAPKCNISCNYCSRKFDCVNESRPGVTSEILSPEQALDRYKEYKKKLKNITVIGIAGPGDALANFEETKKSIELIKAESPDITFCLSTNGLMLPFYANEIVDLGVSHVTITINTIDKKIGAKLYREVNYLGKKYTGEEAAELLLTNQLLGLKLLAARGITCKVNIVYVKGVNDSGIEATVKKVKECGASITNIMPMINAPGSVFEPLETVNKEELHEMRKKCEVELKQMYHCRQCRADAVGMLGKDYVPTQTNTEIKPIKFAVASKTGLNVDLHFGHATEFYIYEFKNGEINFIEKRDVEKYCSGKEDCDATEDKIGRIIETIKDCDRVLALRIGDAPKDRLKKENIEVYQMFSEIKKAIRNVLGEAVS